MSYICIYRDNFLYWYDYKPYWIIILFLCYPDIISFQKIFKPILCLLRYSIIIMEE